MKRELVIKGRTSDEKFNSIEAILRRMGRRLSTKVIGLVPVSPIYDFVYVPDPNGVVLRKLIPAPGVITRACFFIEEKGVKTLSACIKLDNGIYNRHHMVEYTIKNRTMAVKPDLEVLEGDRVTITVNTENAEEASKLKGIWVALLYEINYTCLNSREFLPEQFEKLTELEVEEHASEDQEN